MKGSVEYIPYNYQTFATMHILKYACSGLFMEMGLGKTVATLTALLSYIGKHKILVVAPLAVAKKVWTDEIKKWKHLSHLKVSKIIGTEKERIAALYEEADIYIINVDVIAWLVAHYGVRWPFTCLVLDELSKFKSHKSARFKAIKSIRPRIKKVIGLTGTPMPNNMLDLWSQLFLLDRGKRLGEKFTEFRRKYFKVTHQYAAHVNAYAMRKFKKGSTLDKLIGSDINSKIVYNKIGDICISMKEKDYLELPPKISRTRNVILPDKLMKQYEDFERELVMELADEDITATNAAVLAGKLKQFSNGAIYDDTKKWHQIHNVKLDALADVIDEAQGQNVLILYSYKHDLARIQKRFKAKLIKTEDDIDGWNMGLYNIAVAHPASIGHGLNLQAGGNIIIWYGLQWSLELYQQANKRLHRMGQLKPVIIHHLLCVGTIDIDNYQSLKRKSQGQSGLMHAVRARIKEYLQTA